MPLSRRRATDTAKATVRTPRARAQRPFVLRYLAALALVALLTTGSHLGLLALSDRQSSTGAVVNVAGKQRMLAQQVLACALLLRAERSVVPEVTSSTAPIERARTCLVETLDQLHADSVALRGGDPARGVPPLTSSRVRSLYSSPGGVDEQLGEFLHHGRQLADPSITAAAALPHERAIQGAATGPLSASLNAVVDTHEREDRAAVARLRSHAMAVTLLILAVLLAEAALVFRPMWRRIDRGTERLRQAEQDSRDVADHDALTGLLNRRAFQRMAALRLAEDRRPTALFIVNVDRFKEVNDSLGNPAGDELLRRIGDQLRDELREEDLLARLGADEFAILVRVDPDAAVTVARRLRHALAAPQVLEGVATSADVSIGISLAPDHGTDLAPLMRYADFAMHRAKAHRTGEYVYTGTEEVQTEGRLRTIRELRSALLHDEFTLHYQPKVDLRSGKVRGVEALIRWDHPTRGLLYPDAFLDLVEDAGLMPAVTTWVFQSALDQVGLWTSRGRPLDVAVNVSPSSLLDDDFPERVLGVLRARRLPATALKIEITEQVLMADADRAKIVLMRLREHGVEIAIDDFGTGYSSLAYLRELPIDELKLDRSFVFPMSDDARAAALVTATIALAHSLGLRLVAEGVEDQTAYEKLTDAGCDQAQGYFISRPMPAESLDRWLDEREAAAVLPGAGKQRPIVLPNF